MRTLLSRVLTPLVVAGAARAQETTVQNDSFESGGPAVIVGDFIPGEQAGARLTSPCAGAIVAVQVGWAEGIPGHPPSLEQAIRIYGGATFPTPGPVLETLLGPVLTAGFINEYRFLDENQTIPLNVPVSAGQQFYVALEFANSTQVGEGGASVFRDLDGCQPGKNVLFAAPGFWLDFCMLLQGDLVIRAVVDCGSGEAGACCLNTGTCNDSLSAGECDAVSGVFLGAGTTCAEADCTGACCFADGTCTDGLDAGGCVGGGGTFQGVATDCGSVTCPADTQACCFGTGCLDLTPADCMTAQGSPQGAGSACDPGNVCPIGACCLPDGSCVELVSESSCGSRGGTYQGNGTACGGVSCPQPTGACCLVGGGCLPLAESDCAIIPDSRWAGPLTVCADGDGNGVADVCDCPADVDGDGLVGILDFLALLAAWGTDPGGPPDVDGDGTVGILDLLALLADWGPC